jgi:phosphate transport system ATP-binding protein
MSLSAELNLPLLVRARARRDTARQAIAAAVASKPKSKPTSVKINIRHLNFCYEDGNQALRDVTVPIYDKPVTAFMRPSGCGKSTLLRVLNRKQDLYPGQRAEAEVLLDGGRHPWRHRRLSIAHTHRHGV